MPQDQNRKRKPFLSKLLSHGHEGPWSYQSTAARETATSSKDQSLLQQSLTPTVFRRIKRLALWMTILMMFSYRYWTGRAQFPLVCNLFGLRCPAWPIHGSVAVGFESVLDAFKANFEEGSEVGASFSAFIGDKLVVDLYGGYHDTQYTKPYDKDSLQFVFSSSKFLVSDPRGIVTCLILTRCCFLIECRKALLLHTW